MSNVKLKNILAENMRRFNTKNLNEQDDAEYRVSQEQAKLKNIADKLTDKLRQLSGHQIDMTSDEDSTNSSIQYKIKTSIKWENGRKGRNYKAGFIHPLLTLDIDPVKDETGKYVNIDTGKLYIRLYPNTNPAQRASLHQYFKGADHTINIGTGMFGKSDDSIVDEILSLNSVANAFEI